MNDPIRDPSNPQYKAAFKTRLRRKFAGRDPSTISDAEIDRTIDIMLDADMAHASGRPVQVPRLMTMGEALKQVTDESPVQSALLSGAKSGADMILGTMGFVTSPFRYAISKVTGDEGIQRTPTVEDLAGKVLGIDPNQVRDVTTARAQTAADMGWKGAALQAPGVIAGALAPMGLAGKGKTLLETGLRRTGAFLGTEAAQQTEQEGYAPGSTTESLLRYLSAGGGAFSSIAGPAAVRALSTRLPGASAGSRILASGAADAASGAVVGGATAPSGQRLEGAIQGAAMNIPGTILDIPEIRRNAAFQNAFANRTNPRNLLGAPDAVPPEIQARVSRLQHVLDTQPNTPETLPTRQKLQAMIDELLGRGPTEVPPGFTRPTRPFGMSERPIDLPGSTLDEQFRMEPPPPDFQAERIRETQPSLTEAEAAEMRRLRDRTERAGYAEIGPETYPVEDYAPVQREPPPAMGDDIYREQTATTHQPLPTEPPQPVGLVDRLRQIIRGSKDDDLTGLALPDRLKSIRSQFGVSREDAIRLIQQEIARRQSPVSIADLEQSVDPVRAKRIQSEVNDAARSGNLDNLLFNVRRRNLSNAERALYEARIDRAVARTYGIEKPPRTAQRDAGGESPRPEPMPPQEPPRLPEPQQRQPEPPQAPPAKLTDLVKQSSEQDLLAMLEPQQLEAVSRAYGLTPKQATAIISRALPKDRPTQAAVAAEKPVVEQPVAKAPEPVPTTDPIRAIADELRALPDLEMTKDEAVAMMRRHGATRDQFVEALRAEFRARTEGPVPPQPKATPEPENGTPKASRGMRAEPTDPRNMDGPYPREAHSGLSALVPEPVREAVNESLGTQLKAGVKAFSDFPESYRIAKSGFDRLAIRIAEIMPKGLRWFSDFIGLPKAGGDLREFKRWSDELTGNLRVKVADFAGKLSNLTPEEARAAHYAAERRTPHKNPRIDEARLALQAITDAEVEEMVLGDVLPREILSKYQQEGKQGYVTRIPSQELLRIVRAARRGLMRAAVDDVGSASIPEPGTHARIAYDAHLASMASDIKASIHGKIAGRKQITLEEAEKLGYLIGKGPLAATMQMSAKNMATLRTMRYFRDNMRSYWQEPVRPEGVGPNWKPKPPSSNWRLADGPEWGALNGKFIRADAFGDLQRIAQPMKSGWYKLLEAFNRSIKVEKVLGRFGFFIKTQKILNHLTNNLAGESLEQAPYWSMRAAKVYADYFRGDTSHPVLQALIKLDQLGDSHLIQEITEGSDRPQMESSYRDIQGVRKKYLTGFLDVFREELSKRMEIAKTTTLMDDGVGGRSSYIIAEAYQAALDAISGFDPVRATAYNPAKPGRKVVPQFSFDGVKELAVMMDNLSKIELALSLYESGGGPTGVASTRKLLGKQQRGRFTALETAEVVRDFYDVRQVPPAMRVIAQIPILGQAFVRWPYIYARNIAAKGYGARNPLTAMTYLAPVAIFTAAFKSQTDYTDEEIEEMRKAAAASPTASPIYNPFTKKVSFVELSDLDTLDQVFRMVNPSLNVRPGPGGKPMRFVRGVMAGNPAGRWLYESFTGNSIYTGTETPEEYRDPMANVPPLPVPFLEDVRAVAKRSKADEANAKNNQAQMVSEEDFWQQMMTGLNIREVPEKGSQRWHQNIGIANSRKEREALWESGAQAITTPRKPKAPMGPRQPQPPRPPRGP